MNYKRENVFINSVIGEYIPVKDQKIEMQVDMGAESTLVSSFIRTELDKHQLDWRIRGLEVYDDH